MMLFFIVGNYKRMLTQVVYTISPISATFWSWMISPAYHIAVPFRSFPISIVRHPIWTTETDMSLQGCVSLLMTVAMVDAFFNSLLIRTFHSIFGHRSVTCINKAAKITKANCGRTQIIHTVSQMSAAFRSWWISHACYRAVWLRSFPIFIILTPRPNRRNRHKLHNQKNKFARLRIAFFYCGSSRCIFEQFVQSDHPLLHRKWLESYNWQSYQQSSRGIESALQK